MSGADCKSPVDERFLGYLSWVLPSPFPSRIFCHPFFARIRDGDAMRSLNQPASRNRRTRQQKKVGKKWMAKNEAPRSLKKLQNLRGDFKSPSFRRPAPSNYTKRLLGSDSAFCNCLPSFKFQIGLVWNSEFDIWNLLLGLFLRPADANCPCGTTFTAIEGAFEVDSTF